MSSPDLSPLSSVVSDDSLFVFPECDRFLCFSVHLYSSFGSSITFCYSCSSCSLSGSFSIPFTSTTLLSDYSSFDPFSSISDFFLFHSSSYLKYATNCSISFIKYVLSNPKLLESPYEI